MAAITPKNDVIIFTASGDTVSETLGNKRVVAIVVDCVEANVLFRIRRKDDSGAVLWSATTPASVSAMNPGFVVSFTTSGGLYLESDASTFTVYAYIGR